MSSLSARRACGLAGIQRATWYYKSQAQDQSAPRMRILDLAQAQARPRFGYERITVMLRREG
jgi:putative transposase